MSNETFGNDDLLDRELFTLSRLIAICAKGRDAAAVATGVSVVPALKVSKKENNTWNRRPLDGNRLQVAYIQTTPLIVTPRERTRLSL